MKAAFLGAFLVLLYGWHWMLAVICLFGILKITALIHDLWDCLSWVDNDNYLGTEEGEYW